MPLSTRQGPGNLAGSDWILRKTDLSGPCAQMKQTSRQDIQGVCHTQHEQGDGLAGLYVEGL